MNDRELSEQTARQLVRMADASCFYGNIFTRVHGPFPEGYASQGHTHTFDHITWILCGRVRIESSLADDSDPRVKPFIGPCPVIMDANRKHRMVVEVGPAAWACVFAPREGHDHAERVRRVRAILAAARCPDAMIGEVMKVLEHGLTADDEPLIPTWANPYV